MFMAAQQLADLDRIDEARIMLESGIAEARTQGNDHAAAEMCVVEDANRGQAAPVGRQRQPFRV